MAAQFCIYKRGSRTFETLTQKVWLILSCVLYQKLTAGRKDNMLYLSAAVRYCSVSRGTSTHLSPSHSFRGPNSMKTFSRNCASPVLNSADYDLSKKALYLQLDSLESHETAAICSERGSGCRTTTLRWALHSTEKQAQQEPQVKRSQTKGQTNNTQGLSCSKRQLHSFPGE